MALVDMQKALQSKLIEMNKKINEEFVIISDDKQHEQISQSEMLIDKNSSEKQLIEQVKDLIS